MNTYSIYMYLVRNKIVNYLLVKLNLKYFLSPCVYMYIIQMADERQSGSGSSGSTSSSSSSDTTEGEARDVNEEEKKN